MYGRHRAGEGPMIVYRSKHLLEVFTVRSDRLARLMKLWTTGTLLGVEEQADGSLIMRMHYSHYDPATYVLKGREVTVHRERRRPPPPGSVEDESDQGLAERILARTALELTRTTAGEVAAKMYALRGRAFIQLGRLEAAALEMARSEMVTPGSDIMREEIIAEEEKRMGRDHWTGNDPAVREVVLSRSPSGAAMFVGWIAVGDRCADDLQYDRAIAAYRRAGKFAAAHERYLLIRMGRNSYIGLTQEEAIARERETTKARGGPKLAPQVVEEKISSARSCLPD